MDPKPLPLPHLQRKAFYELVQSDAWKTGLKPLLEQQASGRFMRPIRSLDEAFEHANALSEAASASRLIGLIENEARKYLQISKNETSPE